MNNALLTHLRAKLAETQRELRNRCLFIITRQQLEARAERLRQELYDLEHKEPFLNQGPHYEPRLDRELRFADEARAEGDGEGEEEQPDETQEQENA